MLVRYFLLGIAFGGVLLESEVISWFRIQEMFRFGSFHMYGIIASAIVVAGVSIQIITRLGLRTAGGEAIGLPPKQLGNGTRYIVGGALFGIGWALTGACPGPLIALVGGGIPVMLVAIASALAGTWTYGYLRPRLPHYPRNRVRCDRSGPLRRRTASRWEVSRHRVRVPSPSRPPVATVRRTRGAPDLATQLERLRKEERARRAWGEHRFHHR